jgi:membrane-associated phospholipid phosphatase
MTALPPGTRWLVAAAGLVGTLGVAIGLGLLICDAGRCGVPAADLAAAGFADRWRSPGLDHAMRLLTVLGSFAVLLPAAIAVGTWMRWRGAPLLASCFLPLAVTGAWTLGWAAKLLVARPRPEAFPPLVSMPTDLSFPSAHAMQFATFAFAFVLRPGASPTLRAVAIAIVLASLVGTTRIYLQVHFLTDVLAGVVAAAFWVVALRGMPIWRGARS